MYIKILQKPVGRLITKIILSILLASVTSIFAQSDTSPVGTVAWNNTGTKIAVGHQSGLVEVTDSSTGQLLQSFQLPSVIQVAWNPQNSDILAVSAASLDGPGMLYILDTATGQQLFTTSDGDLITAISWKPDGNRIAGAIGFTARPDAFTYVTIWDISTGQAIIRIPFTPAGVLSLAWSPDSSRIAAGGGDNNITVWDANTGAVINTLVGHTYGVYSVIWSPDGSKLASSSEVVDKTIRVWNASTGQSVLVIPSGAYNIAWSPDGTRIAAPGLPSDVLIWDAATGQLLDSMPQSSFVAAIAWSPNSSRLAIGEDNGIAAIIPVNPVSSPTPTVTITYTFTPTPTSTFTSTWTPTPTNTPTPSPTPTSTFTSTWTPTPTNTPTPSPTPTSTFTSTWTPTLTNTPTPSPTPNPVLTTYGSANQDVDVRLRYSQCVSCTDVNERLAQSFQIASTSPVHRIRLWLNKVGTPSGNLTLSIQTHGNKNTPSGTVVTNGTSAAVAISTLGTSYGWVDFTFSTPPNLSAGTTYWLVLVSSAAAHNTNYVQWGADGSIPGYANGQMMSQRILSSVWNAENKDAVFEVRSS